MSGRKSTKNTGFTFTELLLNVVFLVFLAGVAVPSFSDYLISSEISSLRQHFNVVLEDARSDAFNLNASVSICPSEDAVLCASDWSAGWISFQDDGRGKGGVANDGVRNGEERVLRTYADVGSNKLSVTHADTHIPVDSISFSASGFASRNGELLKEPLLIAICDMRATPVRARGLLISAKGQISRTRDYDNDGRHESFGKTNNEFDKNDEYSLRCS